MDVHKDFKPLHLSCLGLQDNNNEYLKVQQIGKIACSMVALLEGSRGVGKTTFLLHFEPEFQQSDMPKFYVDLSDSKYHKSLVNLKSCFDGNGRMLFLLDSFDEFMSASKVSMATFFSIIQNRVLERCGSLIIATRRSGLNILYHYLGKIHRHYIIHGFTDEARNEYFESVLTPDNMRSVFKEHVLLGDLCKIPLVSEQLLSSIVLKKFNLLDATLTDAVSEIMLGLVSKELSKSAGKNVSLANLHSLSGEYASGFKVMSKLALAEMLTEPFGSLENVSKFLSSFCLKEGIGSLQNIEAFHLIDFCEYVPHFRNVTGHLFWFMSSHIRDFLCGFCVHALPPLDQLHFLSAHVQGLIDDGYCGWLYSFYGLTMHSKVKYSPTRMMMGCINELLLQCLDMERSSHIMAFIGCLMEARETSHWRRLGMRHDKIFDMKLSLDEFEQAMNGLTAMVTQSGIKEWVIEACAKHKNVAAALINRTKSKVSFVFTEKSNLDCKIRLRPKFVPSVFFEKKTFSKVIEEGNEAEDKQVKLDLVCSKAVREILQRVLQLFSKIKLKGDSSNPSYLSFLSCDCLRIAIEDCIQFEPVIPMHCLSVSGPTKMKMVELDMTALHLSEVHEGMAMEFVIILQPTLRRMKFILPNRKEEFEICFRSESLPETVYVDYLSGLLKDLEQVVKCIATEELTPRKCERVYPCMPIPTKNTELMGSNVVLPSTFSHPKIQVQGTDSSSNGAGRKSNLASLTPLSDAQHSSEHSYHVVSSKGMFTVKNQKNLGGSMSPTEQQTSAPAAAMKPGTVAYTAIPELLSADQIHPLPDESSPIQVGGNGLIFHGKFKGLPVAIKKTAYRSKEYAIMVKVRHSNILQLLGFIWGEENPVQRRRYFCYHIMPHMSGDLAGMVIDNPELTLTNLHRAHWNDPHLMEIICGNFLYILSCVLQGLAYLHSLHIAHRDFKASNVLLRFNCNCCKPLTCSCQPKYSVVICDFDAAVQLDHLDQFQPVTILPSGRSVKAGYSLYQCLPVGTNGFRAPECAFEIHANHPDAFSPPICCRCDMFSFGIFCLRFFVGEEGPKRQKVLAMLLLSYYMKKGLVEGRTKGVQIKIPSERVEKMLKIPNLRLGMQWLSYSSDFVISCLNVDPLRRSTASMLLAHPFLRGHGNVTSSSC